MQLAESGVLPVLARCCQLEQSLSVELALTHIQFREGLRALDQPPQSGNRPQTIRDYSDGRAAREVEEESDDEAFTRSCRERC